MGRPKGFKLSEEQKKFLSDLQKTRQSGKNNAHYGKLKPNVSYKALHNYMKKYIPKPEFCQMCNISSPYDLANISGKYLRDVSDWQYLCRRCHMLSDGRMEKIIEIGHNHKRKQMEKCQKKGL